ncbi:MAG: hypothetical protein ACI9FJ_001604, partial [Alteromonadaceae bacterium]
MNTIDLDGNAFIRYLMIGLLYWFPLGALGSESIFEDLSSHQIQTSSLNEVERVNVLATEYRLLKAKMAPLEHQLYDLTRKQYTLSLPLPDGSSAVFRLTYAPVYEAELGKKYPSIRTFKGYQLDNKANAGRFDITPQGFHGMFKLDGKMVFIDPLQRGNNSTYISYYKHNARPLNEPHTDSIRRYPQDSVSPIKVQLPQQAQRLAGETHKTYRLAVAASGEYTQFHGGTKELGQAAIVTMMNRVNEIYEVDTSSTLVLVGNNDTVVFTDPDTDPYVNDAFSDIDTNTSVLESNIGTDNYDIGHIVNTSGGGLAGFGVVCGTQKAEGVTGSPVPTGDPFVIDFVAHEIGHQFGGDHTFNGLEDSCVNRAASAAYEPGSGATIMAYAGICGEQNLQSNSDPYFHAYSLDQIRTFIANNSTCGTSAALDNETPVVSAGNDFTVPKQTPLKLSGSATDAENDSLTYVWEQFDLGAGESTRADMVDDGSRPLFRSWTPSASSERYLPRLADVMRNTTVIGETYATTSRTMNFRLTARDGQGNIGNDSMVVTVDGNSGPLTINTPAAGEVWSVGQSVVVSWNVANTDQSPVSCSQVDILLSTDGGVSFSNTMISGTDNDGSETVTVPTLQSNQARI